MKLIKQLAMILLAIIILLGVIAFLLPSKVRIERSKTIKAPKEMVFDQINNLQNWEKWSPWLHIDTAMELKYYGNEKGEGAGFEWKSDKRAVGCGSLTIYASVPFDSIYAEIDFLNKGKGSIYYLFADSGQATSVKWIFEMNMGHSFIMRYVGLFMRKRIGKDFENGLDTLKKVAEYNFRSSQPSINEALFEPFTYIGIRQKIKPKDINRKMNENFKGLMEFVEKNKLKMTNAPFAVYNSFTKDEVDFEAGIPVEYCTVSSDRIKVKKMNLSKVIVADYYGPYSGLGKEYEAIGKWVVDNKKRISGAPIEMYVSDSAKEKDSTKWLTKIFYPIE
jgi:effector-binding domain-containing protein